MQLPHWEIGGCLRPELDHWDFILGLLLILHPSSSVQPTVGAYIQLNHLIADIGVQKSSTIVWILSLLRNSAAEQSVHADIQFLGKRVIYLIAFFYL